MIACLKQKNPLQFFAVIARRPKADVAISWYNVRIRSAYQEIPTVASLPRNDSTFFVQFYLSETAPIFYRIRLPLRTASTSLSWS